MSKFTMLFSALTILPLTLGPASRPPQVAPPLAVDEELDARDLVGRAKIDLHAAIRAALAAQPGHAVEAGLEGERKGDEMVVFYEVMVLAADGELYEVQLDPGTGAVTAREESEEDEDEIPAFAAALRHSERTLDELVTAAEVFVKGVAVEASLELEGRTPIAEVKFANGRHLLEACVEGRAGHLVNLELEDEQHAEREGDEEHEREDEEREDEGEEEEGEEEEHERGGR